MLKARKGRMTARRPIMTGVTLLTLGLLLCPSGFASSREERLAEARLELEIGMATEQRILDELKRYRAAGETSPERIALYETYLDRVRQLTEEKRKRLQQLEKVLQRPGASAVGRPPAPDLPPPDLDVPEDRELDELRALQQELDQSIAAFDDMLLTESEVARVQSELKMKQLAQEAAQAARSLREGDGGGGEGSEASEAGMESGTASTGSGDETGESSEAVGMEGMQGDTGDASREGSHKETGGGRYRKKGTPKSAPGQGPEASADATEQVAAPQDDDIVARQLREAAEKETDPVLKEKLWKEYHDYKKAL
jgi:hypothetical protein